MASHISDARSDEAKKPEASVAGRGARLLERLNNSCSNPELLKRQSEFLLPHQKGSFDLLTTLGGNDDCPGRIIPGGNYTAAAPYINSGDTTGANNTVTRVGWEGFYCYFYSYNVPGPDHVYSFTLTGRGANPQIQIFRTSGTYEPVAYILNSRSGGCSTGNERCSLVGVSGSTPGVTATIPSQQMNFLPLNVPLHLFVDSARNDASGSGPYTVRIQDVTIAPAAIDSPEFFVRQHYLDFLNREPDASGLSFWINEITQCAGNTQCIEAKRVDVSAAFFVSIEFQETGYLVLRMYKASYGDRPGTPVPLTRQDFLPDTQRVGQGVVVGAPGWEQQLENNKNAFASEFVARSRFTTAFPQGLTSEQFVDALNANAGGALSQAERDQLVSELTSGAKTRAQVLRSVGED
ncbi:MAG: DUF4214 domain-containing protein, partial [Acidobacteria bacterium]|nr:DUF4214 domain-containing protein [Acidobacteriota bacterium]